MDPAREGVARRRAHAHAVERRARRRLQQRRAVAAAGGGLAHAQRRGAARGSQRRSCGCTATCSRCGGARPRSSAERSASCPAATACSRGSAGTTKSRALVALNFADVERSRDASRPPRFATASGRARARRCRATRRSWCWGRARRRSSSSMTDAPAELGAPAEGRGAFGGKIGPRTLVGLVANTAPWLFAQGAPAEPYVAILRSAGELGARAEPTPAERTDYFALCLAAHFASAATFVPTDVDTKIRRALWQEAIGTDELPRMRALALGMAEWDPAPVSARVVRGADGAAVSGHDGERLAVLAGGLVAANAAGDPRGAAELEDGDRHRAVARGARVRGDRAHGGRRARAPAAGRGADAQRGRSHAGARRRAAAALRGPRALGPRALRRRVRARGGALPRAARRRRTPQLPAPPRARAAPRPRAAAAARAVPRRLGRGGRALPGARLRRSAPRSWPRSSTAAASCPARSRTTARSPASSARCRAASTPPSSPRTCPAAVRRALRGAELRKLVAVRRESFDASLAKRCRAVLRAS